MSICLDTLNWDKLNGLIPAIIQNQHTSEVLMLGFMNREALQQTIASSEVIFYSRSKQRLWKKGETSGNMLQVKNIFLDCDQDTLLITVNPLGPTCHLGATNCFANTTKCDWQIIDELESVIKDRITSVPVDDTTISSSQINNESYTYKLLLEGLNRITQKVGEEAVEVIIAALRDSNQAFANEVADLIFHLLILMQYKKVNMSQVLAILNERRKVT